MAFTAWPKIYSHSQIFRYGRSKFHLPQRPNFSDFFYLCLHWVSVVRDLIYQQERNQGAWKNISFGRIEWRLWFKKTCDYTVFPQIVLSAKIQFISKKWNFASTIWIGYNFKIKEKIASSLEYLPRQLYEDVDHFWLKCAVIFNSPTSSFYPKMFDFSWSSLN